METAFISQIKNYIGRHNMLKPDDKILVALSGGADSVALLTILQYLGYHCIAAHCNFHLRGDESMRDEQFVRQLCNQRNVKLEVRDFDVQSQMDTDGTSVEMACRNLRYEWFENVRQHEHCNCIAVAHHRNDNIETMMLNLLRGTGIAGVAGISPINGYIIRPLLCVSRQEIENFLQSENQAFIIDSTNARNDVKRNRLRNIILPMLKEQFPSAETGLNRSLNNIFSCNELYETLLAKRLDEVTTETAAYTAIDIKSINDNRGAEALLFEAIRKFGFNSTQASEMIDAYHRNSVGKNFISGEYKATIDRNRIIVAKAKIPQQIAIDIDGTGIDSPIKLTIKKLRATDFHPTMCDGRRRVCFNEKLAHCSNLIIRHWQKGDRFKPFGMHGQSRLVSDLFSDLKLPNAEKQLTWLLEADGEILWILGYRSGEPFRIIPGNGEYAYFFSME